LRENSSHVRGTKSPAVSPSAFGLVQGKPKGSALAEDPRSLRHPGFGSAPLANSGERGPRLLRPFSPSLQQSRRARGGLRGRGPGDLGGRGLLPAGTESSLPGQRGCGKRVPQNIRRAPKTSGNWSLHGRGSGLRGVWRAGSRGGRKRAPGFGPPFRRREPPKPLAPGDGPGPSGTRKPRHLEPGPYGAWLSPLHAERSGLRPVPGGEFLRGENRFGTVSCAQKRTQQVVETVAFVLYSQKGTFWSGGKPGFWVGFGESPLGKAPKPCKNSFPGSA